MAVGGDGPVDFDEQQKALKDNLVCVDTVLTDPEKMVDFSQTKEPNRIARRSNNIAIKAYEFLKKMKVPNDCIFSESKYWTHKRIRVGITDDINQREHNDPLARLR